MLKMLLLPVIATIGAGIIPAADMPNTKPAPAPGGTIIVKVLPTDNFVIEGEKPQTAKSLELKKIDDTCTPDSRLEEMKRELNKRFKYMFELKKDLDKTQESMAKKWDEYYAMNTAYNKELKRIIADWVTDNMYEAK